MARNEYMWIDYLECVVETEPVAELVGESPAQIERRCGTARKAAVENDDAVVYGVVIVHDRKCWISQKAFPVAGETVIHERRNGMNEEGPGGLLDGIDVQVWGVTLSEMLLHIVLDLSEEE